MVANIVEDIVVHDGRIQIERLGEDVLQARTGKPIRFHLCRKAAQFGDVPVDHWWMDIRSVYGDRKRTAGNHRGLIDFLWELCWQNATTLDEEVQQSYILAHLLPYARSNGSRRVLADAIPTRRKKVEADKATVAYELDRLLRESRGEEFDIVRFRDNTANAIGPPEYDDDVWQRYRELERDLLGQGCEALQRDEKTGLEVALEVWQDWMKSIGRRRGFELEKSVLDILSYECRAAVHRCYSQVWDHLVFYLADKYELTDEAVIFHRFWHLDQQQESDRPEKAKFHLFHGHVFALHPAGGNFMLTQTGRELMGEWLADPHSASTYQRLLHGLAVAVYDYAMRKQVYAELRKKQPDHFGGQDLQRVEEQEVERAGGRRRFRRRNTDAV